MLSGPFQVFLIEINGTIPGTMPGILQSVYGTAKRLDATNTPVPLASIQIVVKKFNGSVAPADPTESEWSAGQLPPSSVTYDATTKTHSWRGGGYLINPPGGKNKIFARAIWTTVIFPPKPGEPEPTSLEYTSPNVGPGPGPGPTVTFGATQQATAVPDPVSSDVIPECADDGWLLYKNIPANLLGRGARLMLNTYTPLRLAEFAIAAKVDWDLTSSGIRMLGVRRPCGTNFFPSDAVGFFPFPQLPIWSLVLHQVGSLDPFVPLSQTQCQPDVAIVDPGSDIFVRVNVPDSFNLFVNGGYCLWINPHIGFPCCKTPC